MSKKTSKLSRKCANKHVQPILDNYMNKSSDDFEDDTKRFTRNTVKNLNKDQRTALSKSITSSKNKIRSALQEFSVDSSSRKPSNNKENAFSLISDNKVSESIEFINKVEKAKNVSSSNDRNPKDYIPLDIDKRDIGRSKHDKKELTENVETTSKTKIQNNKNDTILPPCPLCGKEFRSSLEKRTAHLKECGSLLGMRTEDLIKVHRLEEKQAAEWKALDLPNRVLTNVECNKTDIGNVGISRSANFNELIMKKARKKKKQDNKIIIQSSNDPNLEIALALSASLAQDKPSLSSVDTKRNQDETSDNRLLANEDKNLPTSLCSNNEDQKPDVIMPTASCWWKKTSPVSKKPCISSRRGCNKRHGKTKLELLSDKDRGSKISEEVAKILTVSERVCSDVQENLSLINENGKDFHFFSSPQRQHLRQQWKNKKVECLETNLKTIPKTLWEKSQHYNIKDEYYVEAFIKYKLEPKKQPIDSVKTVCTQETKIKDNCQNERNNSSYFATTKVCQDFEDILESGSRSDITIYSKNEEPLKCHTLILYTRCKKILEDAVSQKTLGGNIEAMLCWNSYDYCVVKSVIRYIYCGKLPCDIRDAKEWKQHKTLSNSYGIAEYSKYLDEYDKSTFLAEAANDIASNDKHDTTGGFLDNSSLTTENYQDFDENKGTTQHLDLLLNEFDANGSANNSKEANDFQPVTQIKDANLFPGDSDEEWNDVHEHLTQKPDHSLPLDATSLLDLTAGQLKLPEEAKPNFSDISQTNEQSQLSRSDSPDMFADEDENNLENDRTSTPHKHSKSFVERFKDIPASSKAQNKDDKSQESLLSHKNLLSSPIAPQLCNSINIIESCSNQTCEISSKVNTESTTHESPITENLEDEDIPKLSTPIDFSDNESFNDIYLETEDNQSLVKSLEKSNCEDLDSSKFTLNSVQLNENKDNTSCRISSIRSKLKSVDATNLKTIEILLQELLTIYDITIETLVQTGIGKTVKELAETCSSETVKRKAKLLVSRWTLLVNQHVETQEKEIQITNDVMRTPSRANSDTQMITPRPEYEAMITPAIRDELKKYGIRNMSKAKAIPLLDHIYKETHPIMEFRTEKKDGMMNSDISFDTISNSSNDSADHELMEESLMLNNQYDILTQDQSQPTDILPETNLRELILKYIQSDKDLYNKCLTYEPFWLEQFFKDFKPFAMAHNLTARQINLKLVTDILDNECLTFRTGASANRNRVAGKKSVKSKPNSISSTSQRKKGKKRLSSSQTAIAPTKKRGRKNVYATQS